MPTKQDYLDQGFTEHYGILFPPITFGTQKAPCPQWKVEGMCFLNEKGESNSKGWLGRAEHFKRFVNCIWGDPNDQEGYFEWNPNAERMLKLACQWGFLSIAGCASSGKSQFCAMWAVAMFILRPMNTKVLVTSMTIQTAEGKIWGICKKLWRRACRVMEITDQKTGKVLLDGQKFLGGKLLDSMHIIKRQSHDGTLHSTEGIELIPAEAGEFKKSATKMQGYKSGYVFLVADELATLAPNILETAKENLFVNENFQLVGAFNPDSHYDPGGVLSTPKDGWDSVDENSEEWETVLGYCIRFDGTKSPNVLAGEKLYRGLMTLEKLNGFKELHPEKSVGFWKMVRGFWSPTGSMDCIYSESELEASGALRPVRAWIGRATMVAGFDPAWTSGGDRATAVFARVGLAKSPEHAQNKIMWEHVETCIFDEEVGKKGQDKPTQIAKQFAAKCRQHGVQPEDIALDITGGHAFAPLLALELNSRAFMAINFGGSASDLPMPSPDKRTCKEAFRDMMSELWYSSKHLIRLGQIKNIPAATVVEMCARTYSEAAGRIAVEAKDKMRKRIQKSPDRGDATFLSIYVARKRHGLAGKESVKGKSRALEDSRHVIDRLTDWGRPQKVTDLEPALHVEDGGGWGDFN